MMIVFSLRSASVTTHQSDCRHISLALTSNSYWINCLLEQVTQLNERLTEDQEVAGSTPAGLATFFRGE